MSFSRWQDPAASKKKHEDALAVIAKECDWREVEFAMVEAGSKSDLFSDPVQGKMWVKFSTHEGQVTKTPISNLHNLPSQMYFNLTPDTYVKRACDAIGCFYGSEEDKKDVWIQGVQHDDKQGLILVSIKCPATMYPTADPENGIGITALLMLSYKQTSSTKVIVGGLRFVCTNGSVFSSGKNGHAQRQWRHTNKDEDMIASQTSAALDNVHANTDAYISRIACLEAPFFVSVRDGNDKEWKVKRSFFDAGFYSRESLLVASMLVSFPYPLDFPAWSMQQLLLAQIIDKQDELKRALNLWELYNVFTNCASHGRWWFGGTARRGQLEGLFLEKVHAAFEEDGHVWKWFWDSKTSQGAVSYYASWIAKGWSTSVNRWQKPGCEPMPLVKKKRKAATETTHSDVSSADIDKQATSPITKIEQELLMPSDDEGGAADDNLKTARTRRKDEFPDEEESEDEEEPLVPEVLEMQGDFVKLDKLLVALGERPTWTQESYKALTAAVLIPCA